LSGMVNSRILKVAFSSLTVVVLTLVSLIMYVNNIELDIHGIVLSVDSISLPFILNIGIVGIAAIISSYEYLRLYDGKNIKLPYYFFLLLFVTSMMIIPMLRNWLVFIFFWEVMTLMSYLLVIYDYKDAKILSIGRNYFILMHVFSTSCLLLLFMLVNYFSGTYDFTYYSEFSTVLLCLGLIGFGIKAGLFPLHFWLPQVHPIAPSPISALLSGSMVKLGIYGLARLLVLLRTDIPSWFFYALTLMALFNVIIAFIMYPLQKDIKRLFAWSTIDNIGWIMFLVAILALNIEHAETIIGLYVLSHGLAKASVFILSGGMIYVYGTRNLNEVKGMVHSCKSLALLFVAAILALEGVPPFSLFLCKHDVVLNLLHINMPLAIFMLVNWVLVFVIFLAMIHEYLFAEGKPEILRPLPCTISYTALALIIASTLAYPLLLVLMGVKP